MRQRIIDAIKLELSMMDANERLPSLFHTNGQMFELAIEEMQYKNPSLNDVLRPIEKIRLELIHGRNSPTGRMETILRLNDLQTYIRKHWKFI